MCKTDRKLSAVNSFLLFCLENYRNTKKISGKKAVNDFVKGGVLEFLASGYEVLHTQSRGYILSQIEQFIESENGALPRQY